MHRAYQESGATLVAISPELQVESRKIRRGAKLDFDILFDQDNQIAEKFGLVHGIPDDIKELYVGFGIDLERTQGNNNWQLPMPARYIIKSDGTIAYAESDPDYTTRPEPEHTLAALKELS